jgi:hypothetical protein
MNLSPIALFVYNRPVHTRRTVEALLKNKPAAESELFIFSDAAKRPEVAESVRRVRQYIRTITGFKSVTIVERDRNWGLANSIIDGVTSVVNQYGRIIVLEDDLIVSSNFLAFMNASLDLYKDYGQVMQISGYMFPVSERIQEDAVFLPLTTSWGWATWDRAWRCFDPSFTTWAQIKNDTEQVKSFDLDGAYPYSSMMEAQVRGEIDSWAIRWYASVFLQNGLVLFPRITLVYNSGLEGSGTHGEGPATWKANRPSADFAVTVFPREVCTSPAFMSVKQVIAKGQAGRSQRLLRWLHGFMARA